jgi:FkbM family methyltransferase
MLYVNLPKKYNYKKYYIELPAGHMLPIYQQSHPKYDHFLPHLGKYLIDSDVVIDIGANVGDTLAGMVEQNPTLSYICIEPDYDFYHFLNKNIGLIKNAVPNLKVRPIKALVGKNITNVLLEGAGGTKNAIPNDIEGIKSVTLDKIIDIKTLSNVRILKSDVDGYDYDVLDASMSIIEKFSPLIYFECQYEQESQKDGYLKTIKLLKEIGYCDWFIFDNFGEFIIKTDDLAVIKQLVNYIWRQNIGRSTRTVYYYDILAAKQKDSQLLQDVLIEYLQ